MESMATKQSRSSVPISKPSRGPLLLLLAVSVLPLLLAIASYRSGVGVPEGRVNRGELVLDRPPLTELNLVDARGQGWNGLGRWQLLLRVESCQQHCQQWRHQLVQLITALGKDRNRVAQQLLTLPTGRHPDALAGPALEQLEQGIWLADPLGNLVLHYRLDQPPQALMKDLKRLLRVSKVG